MINHPLPDTIRSQRTPASQGSLCSGFILHRALRPDEFVTHLETFDNPADKVGAHHHGHYFDSYAEALADYEARCKAANLDFAYSFTDDPAE